MIIPVKCVTCGMVLADKYRFELGLTKMCCRRHLLTHVDIE